MRALLLAGLALTASLQPSQSDACGYIPRIQAFMVNHVSAGRAVVALRATSRDALAWRRHTGAVTADGTQTVEMTLVGPAGARVVTSTFLADPHRQAPTAGVEVAVAAASSFAIAIAGAHADATWAGMGASTSSNEATMWMRAQGIDVSGAVVTRVPGGELEIVAGYARGAMTPTYFLRTKTQPIQELGGPAVGVITTDGTSYLVVAEAGGLTTEIL